VAASEAIFYESSCFLGKSRPFRVPTFTIAGSDSPGRGHDLAEIGRARADCGRGTLELCIHFDVCQQEFHADSLTKRINRMLGLRVQVHLEIADSVTAV
jgi:hypothetical protein